jgi:OOP family OmpA-OmpF porin
MKKTVKGIVALLAVTLLAAGCAMAPQPMASFTPQNLSSGYMPKVDNFVVVFDASSSMTEPNESQVNAGHTKFDVAKALVDHMNQTMPPMAIQGGMNAFGLAANVSKYPTVNVYGMTGYTRQGLSEGLQKITRPGGTTPIGLGLADAGDLLKGSSGKSAVILFSDGKENTASTGALTAAQELKAQYGDNLCLYTVLVGNDAKGRKLMSDLAAASGCGFATTGDDISSSAGMADFVEKVFLTKAMAKAAPQPAPPPPPLPQPKISWILSGVNFDLNKSVVRQDAKDTLKNDIQILKENPQLNVQVQGYTCDLGDANYNLELSDRRAKAIKDYLVSQGIAANRLSAKGFGEANPRWPNDSEANRAKNRRVELVPMQ